MNKKFPPPFSATAEFPFRSDTWLVASEKKRGFPMNAGTGLAHSGDHIISNYTKTTDGRKTSGTMSNIIAY